MSETAVPAERSSSLRGMAFALLAVLSLVYSLAAVIGTYDTFNHTWDEPAHIATGVELLDLGTYKSEPMHPPIARAALAFGPWLLGATADESQIGAFFSEGRRILYETGDYQTMLTAARLGNLPFLFLTVFAVWLFAERLFGRETAALAVFFTCTIPPLIGTAAVATIDLAPVGFGILAMALYCRWLETPDNWNAAAASAATAAAIFSKFSAIPFLVLAFLAILAWRYFLTVRDPSRPAALSIAHRSTDRAILAAGFLIAWAAYGFQFTALAEPAGPDDSGNFLTSLLSAPVFPVFLTSVPAGLVDLLSKNSVGHPSYFLGETGSGGWRSYYLVALLVRTPFPVLVLGTAGLAAAIVSSYRKTDWRPAAPALALVTIMLFASLTSQINLGIRHVLIVYPILAIGAAYCTIRLISRIQNRLVAAGTLAVLAALQIAPSIMVHPDQLFYFNALAGDRPERILINADLDWGQDLKRLSAELKARKITTINLDYNGSADPARHGLPEIKVLKPGAPVSGWIAVSLFHRAWYREGYAWLDDYQPVTRVGKSIDLYFIPESEVR